MDTVFHFFHLLSCCLSFWSEAGYCGSIQPPRRLMWAYPCICHLPIHPETIPPSIMSVRTCEDTYNTPCLLSSSFWQVRIFTSDVTWDAMISAFLIKGKLGEKLFSWTPLGEKLWFHGVDYFSSQSLKDKAQGRRDCSPFRCTTMGLLS